MKNRNFIPYKSFGDISFGEHCLEVRKKFNAPFEQVYFYAEAKNFSDHFDELGFKVAYDTNNTVCSIETWNYMNNKFLFLEKNITALSFKELEKLLKDNDEKTEPFSIGIYSPKFGISICYENFDSEPNEPPTSFLVVRIDYRKLHK
jgi:hypothetical protein